RNRRAEEMASLSCVQICDGDETRLAGYTDLDIRWSNCSSAHRRIDFGNSRPIGRVERILMRTSLVDRRAFLGSIVLTALSAPRAPVGARAGRGGKFGVPRPGSPPAPADRASMGAFLTGLEEVGYVPGQNVDVQIRYAHGKFDRQPALAREL